MRVLSPRYDGPRPARPDETPAVLRLISRIFGRHCPAGMDREFPHLYTGMERHPDWCHVVTHRGRIVAHTGVYPLELVSHGRRVTAGGIGAVCADERHRRQGMMSALLEHCTEWMRTRDMPLSILWGDPARYARFGWTGAGEKMLFALDRRSAGRALDAYDLKVDRLRPDEDTVEEMRALHRKLPVRVERTSRVFRLLLRKIDRRILVAKEGRRVSAYIVARVFESRRGSRDWWLEDVAGSDAGVLSILGSILRGRNTGHVRGEAASGYHGWLGRVLGAGDCWHASTMALGQVKMVDETEAFRALGVSSVSPLLDRTRLDSLLRVKAVFGPAGPARLLPPGASRRKLERRLPVPLYLAPLDHV